MSSEQVLGSGVAGGAILVILGLRFLLSGACYAAWTPGGLFAPLLALGATRNRGGAGVIVLVIPK